MCVFVCVSRSTHILLCAHILLFILRYLAQTKKFAQFTKELPFFWNNRSPVKICTSTTGLEHVVKAKVIGQEQFLELTLELLVIHQPWISSLALKACPVSAVFHIVLVICSWVILCCITTAEDYRSKVQSPNSLEKNQDTEITEEDAFYFTGSAFLSPSQTRIVQRLNAPKGNAAWWVYLNDVQ